MLIGGVILYLWQRKAHLHRLNLSWQAVFLPDVIEVGRRWKGRREKRKVVYIVKNFFFIVCGANLSGDLMW